MIAKWKVFNFKSVGMETELEFAPLTLFAGANSSGKSTFLQSILLVAQTLAHKVSSRSVVLNGAFTRLGQFDDLRTAGADAGQVTIEWTCKPSYRTGGGFAPDALGGRLPYYFSRRPGSLRQVSCELSFDADPSNTERELLQLQPRLVSSRIESVATDEQGVDVRAHVTIRQRSAGQSPDALEGRWLEAVDQEDEAARAGLAYEVRLDEDSLSELREDLASAEPVGSRLRHFLPERLWLGMNRTEEDARAICQVLAGDMVRGVPRRLRAGRDVPIPSTVMARVMEVLGSDLAGAVGQVHRQADLFSTQEEPRWTLSEWVDGVRRLTLPKRAEVRRVLQECTDLEELIVRALKAERGDQYAVVWSRPPSTVLEGIAYLDNFFSSQVRYLGPLRDEPKPLYPLEPAADPSDVGLRGQHTAAVLDLHKHRKIRYIPSSYFKQPSIQKEPTVVRTLEAAVTDWLQYLGVAEGVHSQDRGKLGHELKVNLAGSLRANDLTHVGVGVSQVLPILVMSLLAEEDTTMVFEQPEAHLHPSVQTLLGDFFLSISLASKQCVVETHSEYLINRLRFRAAAEEGESKVTRSVRIYFVEKAEGVSAFRSVVVNEYGAIQDWPEGFFDQSQREAEEILKAAMKKKQRARAGKKS